VPNHSVWNNCRGFRKEVKMTKQEVEKLRNEHAKPEIRRPAIEFDAFSAETVVVGGQDTVQLIRKGSKTSLDYDFYTYTNGICSVFGITTCWNLLIRSNESETKLYRDNIPISLLVRAKKPLKAMRAVFENDIVDILGLSFQDGIANINPEPNEKVFCIISKGYMHGLYFDLTGKLDPEVFKREIGFLYREMAYANLYMALDEGIIEKMIGLGWFPFVQIIGIESQNLIALISENKIYKIASWINGVFPDDRIRSFSELWKENKIYKKKQQQFEAGLKCFFDMNYISAITTLTPLIEGAFNEYMIQKTGSATSNEAVRNTITHGRANDESFTRERALQILLAIDQLFFYMDK
jgi:hypothetical protein